jgi:hypothetical protein
MAKLCSANRHVVTFAPVTPFCVCAALQAQVPTAIRTCRSTPIRDAFLNALNDRAICAGRFCISRCDIGRGAMTRPATSQAL